MKSNQQFVYRSLHFTYSLFTYSRRNVTMIFIVVTILCTIILLFVMYLFIIKICWPKFIRPMTYKGKQYYNRCIFSSIFLKTPKKLSFKISHSQKIFKICFKFDHKLVRAFTTLVQAVLNLATGRTRSCPRSLSLTLLKKKFQNVKLDLFRHI